MARKTKYLEITAAGRDQGKTFFLAEMPARAAEKWAARAFLAVARSNVDVPPEIASQGVVGLAIVGLQKLMGASFHEIEPLMDEMMLCVSIAPNRSDPSVIRPATFDGDIEEVATLLQLRKEVFELHSGFTLADGVSTLKGAVSPTAQGGSQTTQTSPG